MGRYHLASRDADTAGRIALGDLRWIGAPPSSGTHPTPADFSRSLSIVFEVEDSNLVIVRQHTHEDWLLGFVGPEHLHRQTARLDFPAWKIRRDDAGEPIGIEEVFASRIVFTVRDMHDDAQGFIRRIERDTSYEGTAENRRDIREIALQYTGTVHRYPDADRALLWSVATDRWNAMKVAREAGKKEAKACTTNLNIAAPSAHGLPLCSAGLRDAAYELEHALDRAWSSFVGEENETMPTNLADHVSGELSEWIDDALKEIADQIRDHVFSEDRLDELQSEARDNAIAEAVQMIRSLADDVEVM